MTGETTRSWSWLHNVAVPAIVAAIGATWVSTWLGVVTHVGPDRSADVPFVAVAAPAVIAVAVAALGSRIRSRRRRRAVIGVVAVAGAAISAGIIAGVIGSAPMAVAALHPWDLHGAIPVAAGKLAWFVAIVAWLAGLWLGRGELEETQVMLSVGLAVGALVLFFLVGATDHRNTFHHGAGTAAVLFLVAFPGGGAALALVHERELERRTLRRPNTRPSAAWLVALGAPMAVVAGAAVLLALVIGPLAPLVGRALEWTASTIWSVLSAVTRWLGGLFHVSGRVRRELPGRSGARGVAPAHPAGSSLLGTIILIAIGTAIAALVLYGVIRVLIRLYRYLARRARPAGAGAEDDEVDSVFSWGHLLDQLLGLLRRRLRRLTLHHHPTAEVAPASSGDGSTLTPDSVRAHYRSLLVQARTAGYGRLASETPIEYGRRLDEITPEANREPDESLDRLTVLYDRIRYGPTPAEPDDTAAAGGYVAAVTARLVAPSPAADPPPD
jgi:uncharacterized membrane protein YidH (DUF202 family)